MTKKIKFPLEMVDGVQVRTIDELQENFNIERILGYFLEGKLLTWLSDRYYEEEAEQIAKLKSDDVLLKNKICEILGVEYNEEETSDIEKIERQNKKIAKLKQFTDDDTILSNVNSVAFDQEELADLIDEGKSTIYLCQNKYNIPLRVKNKIYIGVGKVEAVISSSIKVDFDSIGISFVNVDFDQEYCKIVSQNSIEKAKELFIHYDLYKAIPLLEELIQQGNCRAKYMLGKIYYDGCKELKQNTQFAFELWNDGAEKGDILCKVRILLNKNFNNNDERKQEYGKVKQYLKDMCNSGDVFAQHELGVCYLNETDEPVNYTKAIELFTKAANKHYWNAYHSIALRYDNGQGVDRNYEIANSWYLKAAEIGYHRSQYELGYNLIFVLERNISDGISWIKKAFYNDNLIRNINSLIDKLIDVPCYTVSSRYIPFDKYYIDTTKKFSSKGDAESYATNQVLNYCSVATDSLRSYSISNFEKNENFNQFVEKYISYVSYSYKKFMLILMSMDKICKYDKSYLEELKQTISSKLENLPSQYNLGNFQVCDYYDAIIHEWSSGGIFSKREYWVESSYTSKLSSDLYRELDLFAKYSNACIKELLEDIVSQLQGIKKELER